jgi:hypothetical protein
LSPSHGLSVVTVARAKPLHVLPITILTLQFVMSREPLRIVVSLTIAAARLRCVTHGDYVGRAEPGKSRTGLAVRKQ